MFHPAFKPYKQEGKTGMFQSMLWALSVQQSASSHVPVSWGEYFVYFRNNYLGVYWDERGFEKVASAVMDLAPEGLPATWEAEWQALDAALTDAARELVGADLASFSTDQLRVAYDRLFDLDQRMWRQSIFIDTFDAGFDQARMKEIAAAHGLSDEEVQTLVSPTVPAYVTEWNRSLKEVGQGNMTREALRHRFFWCATDYWQFGELTDDVIAQELAKANEDEFAPPVGQEDIVKTHGLARNPLLTFQTLTVWRDDRKRLNYTGLYGLMKLLGEGLSRLGIDPTLANAVLPHQAADVFAGRIGETTLRAQSADGVMFHAMPDGNSEFLFAHEADAAREAIETLLHAEQPSELRGMVASRGKAVGRVRIVPHIANSNASLMQAGDVLVTSMTRPEFLPLMRLAGAILTNEGGITSHAAIVSRELGKPCIIGMKNVTKLLNQGDEVEVDAEKGIVRIIKRA